MKSIKVLKECSRSKQLASITASEKDFFGIGDITSKDIAGSFRSTTKLPIKEISDKYKPLIQKRNQLENVVVETHAGFGSVRFDKDNVPKTHGQFETIQPKILHDTIDIKQRFMPDADNQPDQEVSVAKVEHQDNMHQDNEHQDNVPDSNPAYKIREVNSEFGINQALRIFKQDQKQEDESSNRYANLPPLSFIFNNAQDNEVDYGTGEQPPSSTTSDKLSGHKISGEELEQSIAESANRIELKPPLEYDPDKDPTPFDDVDPDSEEYHIGEMNKMKHLEWDDSIDEEFDQVRDVLKSSPHTNALQYLKNVRSQKVEPQLKSLKKRFEDKDNALNFKGNIVLDSQGFRNYTNQVPNWENFRRVELLNYLKNSIVYDNYGIVAINKPYGIASHETVQSREPIDINSLMQEVAVELKHEKLFLAHRLDKTTTGVLLFATTQEKVAQLNKLFRSGQINKTYWCLVKGIPNPEAAIIDIPIGEFSVAGKARSCLCPEKLDKHKQFSKRYREARRAVSEFRVLESNCGASLVEVKPRTGVKHQIRCHMSFGMGTPILGDHKYSRMGKVAPQQLSVPILKALQLRQQKSRTLPLHLHSKSIVIPGAKANGETLFIKAPLPNHFVENMKSLKIKIQSS